MRAQGEGTISYDAHADRWRGIIDLGRDGTGKRRRRKVTARTRKEAAEKLARLRADIDDGALAPSTMTVADLIAEWTEKVTPTMTPRNRDFCVWTAQHSADKLGAYRLTELRAHHIDDALAELADEDLNRTSLTRVRSTLRRILKWGQGRDYIGGKNVADFAELPDAKGPGEGRSLTHEELTTFLAAIEGDDLEALWRVMVGLGLRPAEALGLDWDAVDFDEGVLHVRQALKAKDGKPVLGEVKTAKSHRSLAMPAPVVDALRRHRTSQLTERLALGWSDEWDDLVFRTENGTPIDRSNARRTLNRIIKDAEMEHFRLYDLRHTCASMLADAGVPLEQIADFLGHEGTTMARTTYVHRLTEVVDAAVIPMARAMGAK